MVVDLIQTSLLLFSILMRTIIPWKIPEKAFISSPVHFLVRSAPAPPLHCLNFINRWQHMRAQGWQRKAKWRGFCLIQLKLFAAVKADCWMWLGDLKHLLLSFSLISLSLHFLFIYPLFWLVFPDRFFSLTHYITMHSGGSGACASLTLWCTNPPKTHISASWGSEQHPQHASPGGFKCSYCSLMHPPLLSPPITPSSPAPPLFSPLGIASTLSPSLSSSRSPFLPLFSIFPQQQPHPGCLGSALISTADRVHPPFPKSSQILETNLPISASHSTFPHAPSWCSGCVLLRPFAAHFLKDVAQISCIIITGRLCLNACHA